MIKLAVLLTGLLSVTAVVADRASEQALLVLAERAGELAVIVTLAELTVGDENAIKTAQDDLLAELAIPATAPVKRYRYLPQLGLVVNAELLRRLLASSKIAAIDLDSKHRAGH